MGHHFFVSGNAATQVWSCVTLLAVEFRTTIQSRAEGLKRRPRALKWIAQADLVMAGGNGG